MNDPDLIRHLIEEPVEVVPYDVRWPVAFQDEKTRILEILPAHLLGRIDHFGSTAIPGMPAKPIVDMLVEVFRLDQIVEFIPAFKSRGYDYVWRPTHGDDGEPFYHWFIRRDAAGRRTHHLHIVEPEFEHWDRLLFRDYLIEFPQTGKAYAMLKLDLQKRWGNDRVAYTRAKTDFIAEVTTKAKAHYRRT